MHDNPRPMTGIQAISSALVPPAPDSRARDARLLRLAMETGPGGQALSLLEQIDLAHLSAHDRIDFARCVTEQAAWLEAFSTVALASICGPTSGWPEAEIEAQVRAEIDDLSLDDATSGERLRIENLARSTAWETRERAIALEVSLATRVSTRTAGRRIDSTRFMVEAIPEAIDEAWAGRWGYGHLRVAEKELAEVDADVRRLVLSDVIPHSRTDHPRRLTERIRKSIARRDASGVSERTREKSAQRDVAMWTLADGQSRLAITGPHDLITSMHREINEAARALKAVLDAQPDVVPEEDRRIGAVRVDCVREGVHRLAVLTNPAHAGNLAEPIHSVDPWLTGPDWVGSRPSGPGSRPRADAAIVLDAATALHLANEPGFVPGYGWIPAELARELLADAPRWRRWLVDDASRQLIEVGKTKYRPSQALRDLVAARDITCTADTCTRPAVASQLDHAIDFDGSNTTPANVHAACGPDHMTVTAGYFVVGDDEAGRITWTSTTSDQTYPSHPPLLYEGGPPRAHEGGPRLTPDAPAPPSPIHRAHPTDAT